MSLIYRAIRPLAWAPFFIGYLLGVGTGNATLNPNAWLGCVVLALGCVGGIAMNNYADRYLDKISSWKDIDLTKNPWSTGELEFKHMVILVVVSFIPMIILAYLISPLFLILNILSWLAGTVFYSHPLYLKGKAPFDVICMPVATFVFPFLAGYWLNSLPHLPVLPIILSVIFGIDIFIASEVWDIFPDRISGLKTTAVVLGKKRSNTLRNILKIIQATFVVLILITHPFKWQAYAIGILTITLIPSYKHLKLQWLAFLAFVIFILTLGTLS